MRKQARSDHEIAVAAAVHRLMPDGDAMLMLSGVVRRLRSGYYDPTWVRVVMQYWDRYLGFDLQDAYCFAQIHAATGTGKILTAEIEIGQVPLPDKDISGQNKALGSLPSPFHAVFRGGKADEDGFLRWERRIAVGQELSDRRRTRKQLPCSSSSLRDLPSFVVLGDDAVCAPAVDNRRRGRWTLLRLAYWRLSL